MKTTTIFTSQFLGKFEQLIFKTEMSVGWEKEWTVLTDKNGNSFTDMQLAIEFVRSEKMGWGVGLATLSQAKMENAEWDNL